MFLKNIVLNSSFSLTSKLFLIKSVLIMINKNINHLNVFYCIIDASRKRLKFDLFFFIIGIDLSFSIYYFISLII